jgi:peptide chain release factor subunit 1
MRGTPNTDGPSGGPRGVDVLSEDRIRSLAAHRGNPIVTSCYLDVDGRRHPRHVDYENQLEHLVRQGKERAAGLGPAAARSVEADLDRITAWVRGGFERSRVRGLAFFACSAEGYFEVVESPRPVRNEVVFNHSPHVRQLHSLLDEYERFAVVLVDRHRTRLFRFELGELSEHTEVFDAAPRRSEQGGRPGPGDRGTSLQRHSEEVAHKHLKHAAEVTFEEIQRQPVDHVILGGPHEAVVEFEALLHPYVRERLAARLSVMVTASPEEVRQAALEVECRLERQREATLVERLRNAVGRGNGGVAGLEFTLRALVERRVDTLVLSEGYEAPGWRCGSCRFLAVIGRGCPVCGASMQLVDDVVEQAVEEALTNKCRVQVVRDNADLDVLGRIGALLRF